MKPKKIEHQVYAKVEWSPTDILTLRPRWTPEKCSEWLERNERYIQDRLVELGWEVIESLLEAEDE
jgi:hypothetical protein